jgi:hypothetical protein
MIANVNKKSEPWKYYYEKESLHITWLHLCEMSRIEKFIIETESRFVVAMARGWKNKGGC